MEFISDGNIMKLSQHIKDKHHGKMYLPYEMIKDLLDNVKLFKI
jgi:hypothetical protein